MKWFEESAIQTFQYKLTIWRRYLDDTIVVLCDSLLDDFTAHINSIHPAIQFTWTEECDGTIAMLDAHIRLSLTGQLSFSIFSKPPTWTSISVFEQPTPAAQTGSRQDTTSPMQHHTLGAHTLGDKPPQESFECVRIHQARLGYRYQTHNAHRPPGPLHHQVQGQNQTPVCGAPHRRYLQNHPESRSVCAPQTL